MAFYATMGARSSGQDTGGSAARTVPEGVPSKEAEQKPKRDRTRRPGLPAAVDRALARRRTVVLFFFQRGGADDAATAKAVAAVRRRGGAKVFSAPISRLADYRAVTAGAGVSQAPAVVILRRGRSPRLVEGFVDPETLTQHVADAR